MRVHVNMAQVMVCVGFMLALAITCEGSSFLPIPPYNDNHPRQLYKHHKPFHGTMKKMHVTEHWWATHYGNPTSLVMYKVVVMKSHAKDKKTRIQSPRNKHGKTRPTWRWIRCKEHVNPNMNKKRMHGTTRKQLQAKGEQNAPQNKDTTQTK